MKKFEQSILSLVMSSAAAALLMMSAGATAQTSSEPQEQPPAQEQQQNQDQKHSQAQEQPPAEDQSTAPARRAVPHVTGTVTRWNGDRIDLKTPDGNLQKVAVNRDTERLVEIKEGAEVTVEFRRRISGFVIAERVLPAGAGAEAAQPGEGAAAGRKAEAVTGKVVSWNNAALILRTDAGELTFFLSPSTEYLVKSLDPGLQVTVEYREGQDRSKVATRVLAPSTKNGDSPKPESEAEERKPDASQDLGSSPRI